MYRVDSRPPVPTEEPTTGGGLPRPLRWLLGGFIAVTVGFIVAVAATAIVIFQQYPATVSAPDTVLGLPKDEDVSKEYFRLDELTARQREYLQRHSLFAQVYAGGDEDRIALVVAGSGLQLFPARELATGLKELSSQFERVGEVTDVPTGELGGSAACVNVKRGQVLIVYCGWADHGSLGVTALLGAKDRDEAARWMLDIREAVVTR